MDTRTADGADPGALGHLVSGWLHKRGPTHTYSWRPRWCILTPWELVSYRDPHLCTKIGSVQLSPRAQVFRISELLAPGEGVRYKREKPFGFVLDADPGAGRDRRLEYFDAGDASTLEAWILGVAEAVQSQGTSQTSAEGRQVLSASHLESEIVLASTGSAGDAYLARHSIPTLFNELASMLAQEQPQDPFAFMLDRLWELSPQCLAGNGASALASPRFSDNVELLSAASTSAGPGRRDLRQRVNTGYIRDERVSQGPRFSEDVEEVEAASTASGSKRSLRTRVNTGYIHDDEAAAADSRQGPRFDDTVMELDAASEASQAKHSVRARVNTGFLRPGDLPAEESPVQAGGRGLRFDDNVVQLDAASASGTGPKANVRARVNTGFIGPNDGISLGRRGLRFDDDVQEMEAASSSAGGQKASVRARVNTGYAFEDDIPKADAHKGPRFAEDVEEICGASTASGGSRRSTSREEGVSSRETSASASRGLRFNNDVEELAAASSVSGASAKPLRNRSNTGFIRDEDLPNDSPQGRGLRFDESNQGLRFKDEVEELDAASAASQAQNRKPVRGRVNTGFVNESDVPEAHGLRFEDGAEEIRSVGSEPSRARLQFSDQVEEHESASVVAASAKPVRARVNTGFVREEDLPESQRPGLRFQDAVQEMEAASTAATGSTAKPVRARVNTRFEHDEPEEQTDRGRQVRAAPRFSDNVDVVDAASAASDGPQRPVRTRVNTGFAFESDAPADEAAKSKGLHFADQVEEHDAASETTSGGPARSVRARVNTGFIHDGASVLDASPSESPVVQRCVGFSNSIEQLSAASAATDGGHARSVRARINTGFAFDTPQEDSQQSGTTLRFSDQAEEVEAASSATEGPKRSVRSRVNTGFAFEQEAPSPVESGRKLQFTTSGPEELEAASEQTDGPKRSVRARVNTGYAFDKDIPQDEPPAKRELQFASEYEEVTAASESAEDKARNPRGRVATGYVFEKSAKQRGVKITDAVEELEAASVTTGSPARSVRARVNTGFVFDKDVPSESAAIDSGSKATFAEHAEVLEAASESAAVARSLRARVDTGYIHDGQQDASSQSRGLQFNAQVEELDAASASTEGQKRSVRARVSTGYAFEKDLPSDTVTTMKSLQFDGQVEELEAASSASSGPRRSVRARVNTGFAFDMQPAEADASVKQARVAEAPAQQLEAASAATDGPVRSIRARVNTGFAFNTQAEDDDKKPRLAFAGAVEEVEAASEASGAPARSVRARVNTGYAFSGDVPPVDEMSPSPSPRGRDQRLGLRFAEAADIVEAASVLAGEHSQAAVRSRMATGFVHGQHQDKDDDEEGEEKSTNGVSAPSAIPSKPALLDGLKRALSDGKPRDRNDSNLTFSDSVAELEAASEFGEVRRSVRSRMNTSFAGPDDEVYSSDDDDDDSDFSDEDDEDDEEEEEDIKGDNMGHRDSINVTSDRARRMVNRQSSRGTSSFRSSMLRRRLSSGQESRKSLRLSLHKSVFDSRRRHQQASMFSDGPTTDGPEAEIDVKLVQGAEKDEAMLTASLRPLALFDDLDNEVLQDLIFAMQVYEFKDGEAVLRQGDIGGTHFYVVACGTFEIVKDGKVVDSIGVGATFGESVLLIDGHRTATVRAKGVARVYGLEAQDVRDALHWHYEQEHKEVLIAIDKILESDSCEQLQHLNAFQLHALFSGAEVRQFKPTEVIQHGGRVISDEVFVLTQGSVLLRKEGVDARRVRRCTMFGMRAMLFGYENFSAIADGSTKLLAIPKTVLEEIFGGKSLAQKLMKPEILRSLNSIDSLQHKLDDDQREALANNFDVVEVRKGRPFKNTDARFIMGLDAGKFEGSRDMFRQDIQEYSGSINDLVGSETLLDSSLPWDIQVRVEHERTHIAVWTSNEVESVLAKDATKDRVRIMKSIFLFRTLTHEQLKKLASSMESVHHNDGQPVFSQGDPGDSFCIIAQGRVQIERNGRYIRALSKGDYFGERALLTMEPRSATVTASGPCEIWSISRDTFAESMTSHAIDYLKGRFALQDSEYTFSDLTFKRVVGKGGFGVVKMVETKTGDRYALKCVEKQFVVEKKQTSMLLNERMVLNEIDHPFIVKLVQTFKNDAYVYFLMELVSGGELLEVLNNLGVLDKAQAHFYTGSIVLALEHLHDRRIAYLDLKSENILIDDQGYIKLVDFGLAVKLVGAQNHQVRGTPHFMAPEMILSKGYDTTADLWTLGVCLYEFMVGRFPFGHECTKKSEIFNAVLKAPLHFPEDFQLKSYAEESMDFIRGLLDRKPTKRIGGGIEGYKAFKVHPFFVGFDWDALLSRKIKPPYEPSREVYAEGDDTLDNKDLAKVEAEAEAELKKNGWEDPDPGWDDDFSS